MTAHRKRTLVILTLVILFGALIAALTALGFSSRSGDLGGKNPVSPYAFTPGKGLYLLSFTGELAGDYRGDVLVELTGVPAMDYRLINLAPVRFFGRDQGDGLQERTLVGMQPGDQLALLVFALPQMVEAEGFEVPIASCCIPPEGYSSASGEQSQPLRLSFLRAHDGRPLLQVPVVFEYGN